MNDMVALLTALDGPPRLETFEVDRCELLTRWALRIYIREFDDSHTLGLAWTLGNVSQLSSRVHLYGRLAVAKLIPDEP